MAYCDNILSIYRDFPPLPGGYAMNCPPSKILLALGTAAVLVAGSPFTAAHAQDRIGIYWDEGFQQTSAATTQANQDLTGFIVIREPTVGGGILAWECEVDLDGPAYFLDWDLRGQAINVVAPPRFVVGLAEPLPPADATAVASFRLLVTEPKLVRLGLKPLWNSSLEGRMCYIGGDEPLTLTPLTTASGQELVADVNPGVAEMAIDPAVLNLGEVPLGAVVDGVVTVRNVGGGSLDLDVALDCADGSWQLPAFSGPASLAEGESLRLDVRFTANALGMSDCGLVLGEGLPRVPMGTAVREPRPDWEVSLPVDLRTSSVGMYHSGSVWLKNTGDVPLWLDVGVSGDLEICDIVRGGSISILAPGEIHNVSVKLTSWLPGEFMEFVDFGPGLPSVGLKATFVYRDPQYSISVTELDFASVAAGQPADREVFIRNNATDSYFAFSVVPRVEPADAGFTVTHAGEVLPMLAGATCTLNVTFTPLAVGPHAAVLHLGDALPAIPLTGTGLDAYPACEVLPDTLVFAVLDPAETVTRTLTVRNPGNVPLLIAPRTSPPQFRVFAGDLGVLAPGDSARVFVSYAAADLEPTEGILELGPEFCDVVVLRGVAAVRECELSAAKLEFPAADPDDAVTRTLTIRNRGNTDLDLAPRISSSSFVLVDDIGGPLPPGGTAELQIRFEPASYAEVTALLELGPDTCADVSLHGTVTYPVIPGTNLVGFYFDETYESPSIDIAAGGHAPAYLVLREPTDASGVGGWECRVGLGGPAVFAGVTLAGNALNVADPADGEYVVGVGLEPLPYTPRGILLATFDIYLFDDRPVELYLGPTSRPSLAGSMAWVPWDDFSLLLPMFAASDDGIVARINYSPVLGTEVPRPTVLQNDGAVELVWTPHVAEADGYHVYRRATEGPAVRTTDRPLAAAATIRWTDHPDMPAGGTLHYSYAAMRGDRELARSEETAIVLAAPPALRTRLLASVPNPFNPETRIRYSLAGDGPVSLTIYDVTGRRVRTLVEGRLAQGHRETVWRGDDHDGRALPSGTYYVRLEADGRVDHGKVTLLR